MEWNAPRVYKRVIIYFPLFPRYYRPQPPIITDPGRLSAGTKCISRSKHANNLHFISVYPLNSRKRLPFPEHPRHSATPECSAIKANEILHHFRYGVGGHAEQKHCICNEHQSPTWSKFQIRVPLLFHKSLQHNIFLNYRRQTTNQLRILEENSKQRALPVCANKNNFAL